MSHPIRNCVSIASASFLLFACDPPDPQFPTVVVNSGHAEPRIDNSMEQEDPYIWLEEVEGGDSLAWAAEQNSISLPQLQGDPRFTELRHEIEAVLTSDDRIPTPSLLDGQVYNFWQDEVNVRGVLRRTSLSSFQSDEPRWETLIDIDSLAEIENANWVYKGRTCLHTDPSRCLLRLSDGGKDAVVLREFDLKNRNFVDGGFVVEEAKTNVDWFDSDTLIIGSDFGEDSLTLSGYARTLRLWRRGTELDTAEEIISIERDDMGVYFNSLLEEDISYNIITRRPDFFTEQNWLLVNQGELVEIPFPIDVDVRGVFGNHLLGLMRSDWSPEDGTNFPAGSLVAMGLESIVADDAIRDISLLLDLGSDDGVDAINGIAITKDSIYVNTLKDVSAKLLRIRPRGDSWHIDTISMPESGAIQMITADDYSDTLIVGFQSFLTPPSLFLIEGDAEPRLIKALEPQFDSEPYIVDQLFATSADGTKIPYYIVHHRDIKMDATTPTRLTAYGGFEVSRTPSYMSAQGQAWLRRGGAYVLANIRGGGEYGPAWHQSALNENRQRVFDDFIAVSKHLIDSGYTSSRYLGISGGSNGGLLVTAVMVQRPELYNAIISAVPLIDMLRYHRLLAGASWIAEYGNPEIPEQRDYIAQYSPYQNVTASADYPKVFLWTNPKDDRVHPGHARKMAARMLAQGHDVIYFENTEGGHGGGANLSQLAQTQAMELVYLLQQLIDE